MDRWDRAGNPLALLVDDDRVTAHRIRPWLLAHGLELVHSRTGVAALELLQRLPESFGLVLVSLDQADIAGAVLVETLRHFRPDLPVMCLTAPEQEVDFDVAACLPKPIDQAEFQSQLLRALGSATPLMLADFHEGAIARARARFAVSGDLIDAAREIARGFSGGTDEPY